jgi:hypothetical protein
MISKIRRMAAPWLLATRALMYSHENCQVKMRVELMFGSLQLLVTLCILNGVESSKDIHTRWEHQGSSTRRTEHA